MSVCECVVDAEAPAAWVAGAPLMHRLVRRPLYFALNSSPPKKKLEYTASLQTVLVIVSVDLERDELKSDLKF